MVSIQEQRIVFLKGQVKTFKTTTSYLKHLTKAEPLQIKTSKFSPTCRKVFFVFIKFSPKFSDDLLWVPKIAICQFFVMFGLMTVIELEW